MKFQELELDEVRETNGGFVPIIVGGLFISEAVVGSVITGGLLTGMGIGYKYFFQ
ncbi:class IIb bacteriocin, lactobin A/cerein 7B family [Flammeovirga sp. EKP202]|uniref:class IIb bacteriocin, lactobin A/cerein 7B family n=1 Tax=Flammeovirga sp. EKP202 TaxID=2770592 RepID=UPI00165F99A0|nr:class IIb bacteriocin, lactobin A/cerein 7B family [Flammeovirga sp. EKP202]MBD0404177.1 class IIb bacteriocin, lactobin A/cerein 7B family [Flammeovirga sp. EKP202]